MAVSHLAGTAVTAAIVCNHAIAVTEKEQHLRVPVVRGQRPTVAEHDGLALTPVFAKNFNAVLCFDKAHVTLPDISVQINVVLLSMRSARLLCTMTGPEQMQHKMFVEARLTRSPLRRARAPYPARRGRARWRSSAKSFHAARALLGVY